MPHRFRAAIACSHLVYGPLVGVVLQRKVLAPHRWIFRGFVQFDNTKERVSRLLLSLKDINQQRRYADSDERSDDNCKSNGSAFPAASICVLSRHDFSCPLRVTHGSVTTDAGHVATVLAGCSNRLNNLAMAFQARGFGHTKVA